MKLVRFLVVASLAGCCAPAQTPEVNALTPTEAHDGWILLFDGKTMNGWDDPRLKTPPGDAWTIENDCLKSNAHPRITEDLFSKETYRDFELTWDWRIAPHGNSGVKYRIQDHLFLAAAPKSMKFETSVDYAFEHRVDQRPAAGQDYVVAFEYQLLDDPKVTPKQRVGGLYDMITPSSLEAHPAGEFNHSRIVLRGNHVEHWLNGVKVVDGALDSEEALQGIDARWATAPHVRDLLAKQPRKDCPISLQNHGAACWFRNIKIRKL